MFFFIIFCPAYSVFYRCSPASKIQFGLRCSKIGKGVFPYDVQYSIEDAERYAIDGLIDPLENMRDDNVFVWIGTLDEYIPLGKKTYNVFEPFV